MQINVGAFFKGPRDSTADKIFETLLLDPQQPVVVTLSANIASAAATATTAQLTPPSGKTTADFQAGKLSDDYNPLSTPPIDLGASKYTEVEWAVLLQAPLVNGDVIEFRVAGSQGAALDSYSGGYATVTIGSGVAVASYPPFTTSIPFSMLTM